MKPQFLLRRLGGWLAVVALGAGVGPVALAATLPSVAVSGAADSSMSSYEGTVESLRQTTMAAQVPGAVVELPVRAGQRVSAGQLLLR
ncbi:MAG: biotin/lipoyl-binding protein, partial [Brachymonas denitrificans]